MPQISADVGGVATATLTNTVLFDDLEGTPFKWAQVLPSATRVTTRAYNGSGSLLLTPAGVVAGFWYAAAARGLPATKGRVGLECYWASPSFADLGMVEFGVACTKRSLVAPVRYWSASHYWSLIDALGNDQALLPSYNAQQYLSLPNAGGCWHTFKAVVNFDTGFYETLEVDNMSLNIGGYALPSFAYLSQTIGVDLGTGRIGNAVYFAMNGAAGSDIYIDDVKVVITTLSRL